MNKIILVSLIGFLFSSLFGTPQEQYRYVKDVTAPTAMTSEVGLFYLDSEVYAHTLPALTDIRLFDTKGAEVPYIIRPATVHDTDTVFFTVDLKQEKTLTLSKNSLALIFVRDSTDSIPTKINITTPLVNFEKSVSVFGSNDRKTWQSLKEHEPIFDYSQYMAVRNTTIHFKRQALSYYKVIIDKVWETKWSPFSQLVSEATSGVTTKEYATFVKKQEPFKISGIQFFAQTTKIGTGKGRIKSKELTLVTVTSDSIHQWDDHIYGSCKEPIRRITLDPEQSNFHRRLLIAGTNDTTEDSQWRYITAENIYRIKAEAYAQEKLIIDFATPQRYKRYRFRIENGDNNSITLQRVTVDHALEEVLFFHRNNKRFSLFYGNEESKRANYDIASVLNKMPAVKGNLWKLGSQTVRSTPKKQSALVSPQKLLTVSLVLMVVILAFILFKAVGKVEKTNDSE